MTRKGRAVLPARSARRDGVGDGAFYRYEILGRDGRLLPRKADPVERVTVLAPEADVDPGVMGAVFVTDIAVEVVRV